MSGIFDIDVNKIEVELRDFVNKELSSLGNKLVSFMKSEINASTGKWKDDVSEGVEYRVDMYEPGRHMLTFGLIEAHEVDDFNTIWKGAVLNYGTGQYMDSSNPLLADYKQSELYNTRRSSHGDIILSRPNQSYYDPHTDSYVESNAKSEYEIPQLAHRGVFWFENAITMFASDTQLTELWSRIQNEVRNIIIRNIQHNISNILDIKL